MKKHYCKYHPLSPALWWSGDYETGYCERCVDYSETAAGSPKAKSFLTGSELEYLGSAHSAVPFWERIPAFFKYPFHSNGILFLAAVMLVGSIMTAIGGIITLAGMIFSLAAITKYGFMVIEQTARGDFNPPAWNKAFSGDLSIFFKQIGVQIVFGVFLAAVSFLGSELFNFLASLIVIFLMPASLMVFAMEEDIGSAVSPTHLLEFISRIGGAYFILYVFLILFSMAHVGFFSLLWGEVPETWLAPLFVSASLYFMLVAYHLMGYVIFQYQSALGFVSEDEKTVERRMKAIDPFDARIDVLAKEGRYEDCLKVFKKALHYHPNDFKKHDNLSKILVALDHREAALEHGNSYLTKLHQVGDDARLYFLYSYYQQLDPEFLPDDPGVRHVIAEQLYGRGKYDQVIKMLAKMHKLYPNYQDVPGAYYLLAETLFFGKGAGDKALQFLGFIQHNYPQYPKLEQVQALMAEIKSGAGNA